jgi:hypothetical protein
MRGGHLNKNTHTDPVMRVRLRYEQAVRDLRKGAAEMRRCGASAESIARAMHAERTRLATLFKARTPEPYRTRIYARTVRVYGNEIGPSIEFLRASGKSWNAIIECATRPGPAPDLGMEKGVDGTSTETLPSLGTRCGRLGSAD